MINNSTKINFFARNKKLLWILPASSVIIIFAIFMIFTEYNVTQYPLDYRIFANMGELKQINNYVVYELSDDSDKYLGDIKYEEKYAKEISYNGETFHLYAYKFNSITDAKRYCKKSNRNENQTKSFTFSYNKMQLVAFNEQYAYRVIGSDYKSFAEFYNFMVEDFSIKF